MTFDCSEKSTKTVLTLVLSFGHIYNFKEIFGPILDFKLFYTQNATHFGHGNSIKTLKSTILDPSQIWVTYVQQNSVSESTPFRKILRTYSNMIKILQHLYGWILHSKCYNLTSRNAQFGFLKHKIWITNLVKICPSNF